MIEIPFQREVPLFHDRVLVFHLGRQIEELGTGLDGIGRVGIGEGVDRKAIIADGVAKRA
jgi:hypothetical protein